MKVDEEGVCLAQAGAGTPATGNTGVQADLPSLEMFWCVKTTIASM